MKIAYRPRVANVDWISNTIYRANTSPLSSATYTIEVSDVPIYCVYFVLIPLFNSIGTTAAAPI